MREIPLTQGRVALVDDADYERVTAMGKWRAHKPKYVWYAHKTLGAKNAIRNLQMHRFILGLPPGRKPLVDHIDLDGLNNQKHNLRIATFSQNLANRRSFRNTSGYRGVVIDPRDGGIYARITVGGSPLYLGRFPNLEAAAEAYDEAAWEHFGSYATLNFPPESEPPQ